MSFFRGLFGAPDPRTGRRATIRLGQRELNRITLAVAAVILVGLGYGGCRAFHAFKAQRDVVIGEDNMKALYQAMMLYAGDWDGKLPPANQWSDAVLGYLSAPRSRPGGRTAYLTGPADGQDVGYVYNDLASNLDLEPRARFHVGPEKTHEPSGPPPIEPSELILLIEKPGARPDAHEVIPSRGTLADQDALYKLLSFPHGTDLPETARTLVLYADGHIETLTRKDFGH